MGGRSVGSLLRRVGALLAPRRAPLSSASAQFPAKAIRIVVGFPAGAGPDVVARVIAQRLQDAWGIRVIVDNKLGAGGLIAAQEVVRAAPDGYTLLLAGVAQISIAPSTYRDLPYHPQNDFAPISEVASSDIALVSNPQCVPAQTAQEYLAWAKTQQPLFMGTFGAGTLGHFAAVVFGDVMRLNLGPVHYRSTSEAMNGILRGDVQGIFASPTLSGPHVTAGKLRALGTTGPTRSRVFPEVPTFKELGYPELEFTAWFGVFAPAKTSPEILEQLNGEIVKAVTSPDGRAKLEQAGLRVTGTSRDEFARTIRDDTARWAKVVAATGFKAQA